MAEVTHADFSPLVQAQDVQAISRPSLSYWQDAWNRLKANKRALLSLYLVIGLLLFTVAGPWVWRADPALQDLDQIGQPPGTDRRAVLVADFVSWDGQGGDT